MATATAPTPPTIELFLSTDGKHTVHVSGILADDTDALVEKAREVYDQLAEAYGTIERRGFGGGSKAAAPPPVSGPVNCADCGTQLKEVKFKNGDTWTVAKMADAGTRKFGRPLCMPHYREAKQQDQPF